jgi:hypothetical protein
VNYNIFSNSILVFQDNSWLDSLNKFSENYIIKSRDENKKRVINNKEFGFSNHSSPLINDENLRDTLIDLHNYAAMSIMLLDDKNN